jgi:hypothetical protein
MAAGRFATSQLCFSDARHACHMYACTGCQLCTLHVTRHSPVHSVYIVFTCKPYLLIIAVPLPAGIA